MVKQRGLTVFLNVTNIEKSAAFYDALGFRRAFALPPPMETIGYRLGDASFIIGPADAPGATPDMARWIATKPWGTGLLLLPQVDDVDALHAKARAAGVHILTPPTDKPWGSRVMEVRDPDGYRLMFEQVTTGIDPAEAGGSKGDAWEPDAPERRKSAAKKASAAKAARKPTKAAKRRA